MLQRTPFFFFLLVMGTSQVYVFPEVGCNTRHLFHMQVPKRKPASRKIIHHGGMEAIRGRPMVG